MRKQKNLESKTNNKILGKIYMTLGYQRFLDRKQNTQNFKKNDK